MNRDEEQRNGYNAFKWQKEQTTQYNIRIMNNSGVPEALNAATSASGETKTEYIKTAIVDRLRREGFFKGDFVPNLNKERHKENLKKLEKDLEQEKKKLNK